MHLKNGLFFKWTNIIFSEFISERTWECGKYFTRRSKISTVIKAPVFSPLKGHWELWAGMGLTIFTVNPARGERAIAGWPFCVHLRNGPHTCAREQSRVTPSRHFHSLHSQMSLQHQNYSIRGHSTIDNSRNIYGPDAFRKTSPLHGIPVWEFECTCFVLRAFKLSLNLQIEMIASHLFYGLLYHKFL